MEWVPCFARQGWQRLEPNLVTEGILYSGRMGMPPGGETLKPCAEPHLAGARFKFTHPQRQSGGPLYIRKPEGEKERDFIGLKVSGRKAQPPKVSVP